MHFEPGNVYHVYNRGNKKQPIFFNKRNYRFFLNKVKTEWERYCDILSYNLMPNHFHFMLTPNEYACDEIVLAGNPSKLQRLSRLIGHTLSSYTKSINIQNDTTGNLFQKKTKSKCLQEDPIIPDHINYTDYIKTCFFYIHENPLKANLVKDLENWEFSSWHEYAGLRNSNFCNQEKLLQITGMSREECIKQNNLLNGKIIKGFF